MSHRPSNEDLRAWMQRWELVNERQRAEIRAMSAEEKLRRIGRLMASARLFGGSRRGAEDEAVRELWQRLRAGIRARD